MTDTTQEHVKLRGQGTTVLLGNTAVVEVERTMRVDDTGEPIRDENDQLIVDTIRHSRTELGNQITTVVFPVGTSYQEAVANVDHLWPYHSDDGPEWVEAEDQALAQKIAAHFTTESHSCQVGRPEGWEEG